MRKKEPQKGTKDMVMKEERPCFNKIKDFVLNAAQKKEAGQTNISISGFGAVKCWHQQRIAAVPFLYPCLVLVVTGCKHIYHGHKEIQCFPGEFLAIPAPARYDVVNTPEGSQRPFLALYLHFDDWLIEQFHRLYQMEDSNDIDKISIHLKGSELLDSAIWHFLEISHRRELGHDLVQHRLIEVLLCLVKYCNASHMLLSMSHSWRHRVYSLLLTNSSRDWLISDVCTLLGVSESTLRRKLRKENTDFRTTIEDVRMGLALSEVQFTNLPISIIAGHCGYSSFSRFTSRFSNRFNTTPSRLRKQMAESG
ncbi:MAG: helix-turn-helix domain-containing protein [Proteobacteria bacterium]|nr:helix-turn-helix domain-containing protein [Pseudomonadota bacterium]MBU1581526.1 helix-turn-helix domain-containing protein [Pseudomonadota bacterium]MBU2627302.1 helix-turn-helix domain-containing protein [Pseudomonadota bacterium]